MNQDCLNCKLFNVDEDKDFDFNKWIKEMNLKHEEMKRKEDEIPDSPRQGTTHQINKMFEEFDNNLCRKFNKIKYIMDQEIWGPSGASKILPFDPEKTNKRFNKVMDEFEKTIEIEINKIKNKRNEINEYLNGLGKIEK